jgi:hypothetical protein
MPKAKFAGWRIEIAKCQSGLVSAKLHSLAEYRNKKNKAFRFVFRFIKHADAEKHKE